MLPDRPTIRPRGTRSPGSWHDRFRCAQWVHRPFGGRMSTSMPFCRYGDRFEKTMVPARAADTS